MCSIERTGLLWLCIIYCEMFEHVQSRTGKSPAAVLLYGQLD